MVLYFPAIESATYPPMTGIMKTVPAIEKADGCCCAMSHSAIFQLYRKNKTV